MKSARGRAGLAAVVLIGAALGVFIFRSLRSSQSPSKDPDFGAGRVASPQGDRAVYFSEDLSGARVWVVGRGEPAPRLVAVVRDQGARNAVWSPDGRLIAFESYDPSGHSPMTTIHVWVACPDNGRTEELRPPPPNARFSTYLDRWVSADRLRIRSTLLDAANDVAYVYDWRSRRLEGPMAGDE